MGGSIFGCGCTQLRKLISFHEAKIGGVMDVNFFVEAKNPYGVSHELSDIGNYRPMISGLKKLDELEKQRVARLRRDDRT